MAVPQHKLLIAAFAVKNYLELEDELKPGLHDMVDIIFDRDATEQEINMALDTFAEALFLNETEKNERYK